MVTDAVRRPERGLDVASPSRARVSGGVLLLSRHLLVQGVIVEPRTPSEVNRLTERLHEPAAIAADAWALGRGVGRRDEAAAVCARLGVSESLLGGTLVLAVERHGLSGENVGEGALVSKLAVALGEPLADGFALHGDDEMTE